MKRILSLVTIAFSMIAFGQCDTSSISNAGWSVVSTSSAEPSAPGANAIDGDINTIWHTEWDAAQPPFPHEIVIDLGASYPVDGIGYTPRATGALNGKMADYEIYLSTDGTTWGTPDKIGTVTYIDNNDIANKELIFGAVTAQYVKLIGISSYANQHYMVASEIEVYQDLVCGATGQQNQTMTFTTIDEQLSTAAPITLSASASSALGITYEVVSGPATVLADQLTLDGTAGVVEIKAVQAGDASYYSIEMTQSFTVIDLADYDPTVTTRLTEAYDIQMPTLMAYPIYVNASIEQDEHISFDKVEVEIGGTTYECEERDGFYYYLWTPSAFGAHTVNIEAFADNGNTTTITRDVNVTSTITNTTVTSMQDVVIEFGGTNSRWFYGSYELPQHVNSFDQIIANMEIECPAGDCDDWDRWAHIDVKAPDGNWVQIIRYITPYGVACNHTLDVSNYQSILQGELEFRMFIDTWGTGGWQITLDFDHQAGTPEYPYSRVEEIWDATYDFGNPSDLQPVDTISYQYYGNIEKSTLVVSNTGHGWGNNNSQNAAEFYEANHFIDIDGSETFTQHLWNDCNPNPDNCTGQLGTWTYHRAGWCPGAISVPNEWDMTPHINSTTPIDLTYRFDPTYTDFCHPNNPDCVSGSGLGTTCPDCNDGYKAIYVVDGHLINFSNTPLVYNSASIDEEIIDNVKDYSISVYPNPTSGQFRLKVQEFNESMRIYVQDIAGRTMKTYYFNSSDMVNARVFDLSSLPKGTYFISLEGNSGSGVQKLIVK